MTGIGARHWFSAIAAALAVHAVALALMHEPAPEGDAEAGSGGMEVVLGTAGGGPAPASVPAAGPPTGTVPPSETAARPDEEAVVATFPAPEATESGRSIRIPRAATVSTGPTAARRSPPETVTVPPAETAARSPVATGAARRLPPEVPPVARTAPVPRTVPIEAGATESLRAAPVSETVPPAPVPGERPPKTVVAGARGAVAPATTTVAPDALSQAVPAPSGSPAAPGMPSSSGTLPPDAVSNLRPSGKTGRTVAAPAKNAETVLVHVETASVQARPSEETIARAAASGPGAGARKDTRGYRRALDEGAAGAAGEYYAAVQAWLEKHKRYPRRSRLRGEEGRILLRIGVTRAGRVAAFAIERGSGHARLDEEAGRMVERAQPLPRMPPAMREDRVELLVPVEFFLR